MCFLFVCFCFVFCFFLFLFLENLAFNKRTKMVGGPVLRPSSRAVDGNSQTTIDPSCIHSQLYGFTNPWWRVDLEQVVPVNEVYIVNRGDCCGDRLNPFEIRVGKTKLNEALLKIIVSINHGQRVERNSQNRERSTNIVLHLLTTNYLPRTLLSPYI